MDNRVKCPMGSVRYKIRPATKEVSQGPILGRLLLFVLMNDFSSCLKGSIDNGDTITYVQGPHLRRPRCKRLCNQRSCLSKDTYLKQHTTTLVIVRHTPKIILARRVAFRISLSMVYDLSESHQLLCFLLATQFGFISKFIPPFLTLIHIPFQKTDCCYTYRYHTLTRDQVHCKPPLVVDHLLPGSFCPFT